MTPSRSAWLAALLSVGAMVAIVAVRRTTDVDIWWHLATGREALARRSTLPVDPFSFSFAGAPWRYKDLAADVLLYAGFARLGAAWFVLVRALAAAAMAVAFGAALPAERRDPRAWVLGVGLLLAATCYRISERPLVASLAALCAMLALLDRARAASAEARSPSRRALVRAWAPVLLLQWAWAWMHREALLGLALVGATAAWMLLARAVPPGGPAAALMGPRPSRVAAHAALAATALAAAATALTPSGTATLHSSVAVATSAVYRRTLTEWAPPSLGTVRVLPVSFGVAALALVALAALLARAARRNAPAPVDALHLSLWALFACEAAQSVRWLLHLVVLSAYVLLLALGELSVVLAARAPAHRARASWRGTALVGLAMAALCAASEPHPFGVGVEPDTFPAGALAFARAHGLRPRVVNSFALGGYTIWAGYPAFRVLVDGRTDTVYPPEFTAATIAAQRDPARFAAMRRLDGADWVLAENAPGAARFAFLADDPAWAMLYWSEAAVVYARRDAYPALAPLAFRFVRAPALVDSVARAFDAARGDPAALDAVGAEVARLVAASPEGPRALVVMALYLHARGPAFVARRDAVVRRLVELHPDHPAARALGARFGVR